MKAENSQNKLVRIVPNIAPCRKILSIMKIRMVWKYAPSREEIERGEKNPEERARIVKESLEKWKKTGNEVNRKIDELFEKIPAYQERLKTENLQDIREDMLFCYFAYGFEPDEYFCFQLEEKSAVDRRRYISTRQRTTYRCRMNNIIDASLFNDKMKTYDRFREYFKRDAISIDSEADFDTFEDFVARHPVFVKKAVYLAQGTGVSLENIENCGKSRREYFDEMLSKGKYILEELITQTPEMAAFNDSSVNTIRAISFLTRDGVEVPYCTLRTGRPGSFVDNAGAGGVQACIDYETGTVVSDGYDEIGGVYTCHPASGTVFRGYKMPEWDDLKRLINEAAESVPLTKFIGWDFAHTQNGWVIVEGNENPNVIAKQMIIGEGMRPVFDKIMKDMDLII